MSGLGAAKCSQEEPGTNPRGHIESPMAPLERPFRASGTSEALPEWPLRAPSGSATGQEQPFRAPGGTAARLSGHFERPSGSRVAWEVQR